MSPQVVGRNVSIITRSVYVDKTTGGHHAIETSYQPCTKDRKDVFLTKDGPLFKLKVSILFEPSTGGNLKFPVEKLQYSRC
jgi:hypothetical protein